ncbi:MAG: fimbrillin family protein [Bacteroidales bacterium]|nr:fimbrillin family protein [Bacteroidales bacterium]
MKKTICILWAIAAALSCAKAPQNTLAESSEIQLTPIFPGVSVKASDAGFETGDIIGIYITKYRGDTPSPLQIGGNWGSNLTLTNNGTNWTLDPKVYWEDGKFDIYGYYPKMNVTSVDAQPFQIASDQTVTEGVEGKSAYEASDFLWAGVKGVTQTGTVPMAFQHKMCKVNVKLVKGEDYEGDLPQDVSVYIHSTVTEAYIDLSTGDVVIDNHRPSTSIQARKKALDLFEAIVAPQRLSNRVPLVEVICGQVSYLFESTVIFKSGMQHDITITLSDNPEKVAIDIGGQVENW